MAAMRAAVLSMRHRLSTVAGGLSVAAVLVIAACTSVPTNDTAVVGYYGATLPAASGGGERTVTVFLAADYSATVTSAFSGRPSRFLVKGKWERSANRITVNIEGQRPERIVFDYERVRIVAKEWDRATWGESGPGTLVRQ
jgi:hypothetical protein